MDTTPNPVTVFHEELQSLVSSMVTADGDVVGDVLVKHVLNGRGYPETLLSSFEDHQKVLWCQPGHVTAQKIISSWMVHGFFA